jgi:hypothetical protein
MARGAKKTEHAGAKKGTGAFYGRKVDAKRASSRRRRQNKKTAINNQYRAWGQQDRSLNKYSAPLESFTSSSAEILNDPVSLLR